MKEMNDIKNLCIFGSRNLTGGKIYSIIKDRIEKINPDLVITSGDARGVCAEAIKVCRDIAKPIQLSFLNNKKYAQGMYDHRSKEVLSKSDYIIFIHDGQTKGTKNEIKLADKMGIKYEYILEGIEEETLFKDDFFIDYEMPDLEI
jgi:hypothetical protein